MKQTEWKTGVLMPMHKETQKMKKEDVGNGYYCEYVAFGANCAATKRPTCVGCGGRSRLFKDKSRNRGIYGVLPKSGKASTGVVPYEEVAKFADSLPPFEEA